MQAKKYTTGAYCVDLSIFAAMIQGAIRIRSKAQTADHARSGNLKDGPSWDNHSFSQIWACQYGEEVSTIAGPNREIIFAVRESFHQ
jgi:hypothetical protein